MQQQQHQALCSLLQPHCSLQQALSGLSAVKSMRCPSNSNHVLMLLQARQQLRVLLQAR